MQRHARSCSVAAGCGKWEARDLVEVDLAGLRHRGCHEATSELDLHLRAYRRREDCGAVMHAHPPAATGFAVAGQGLPGDILPEIVLLMGEVPCVPMPPPGRRPWVMPPSHSSKPGARKPGSFWRPVFWDE